MGGGGGENVSESTESADRTKPVRQCRPAGRCKPQPQSIQAITLDHIQTAVGFKKEKRKMFLLLGRDAVSPA